MELISNIFIGIVAVSHLCFLILEMFLWTKPVGLKIFDLTGEFAKASKFLAANQGLYNGFLAAGLVWGLVLGTTGEPVKIFFLVCVIIAGVFGTVTVSRKILLIQALPAVISLILLLTK